MKVVKNINNNVSICIDNNNNEVIAIGQGIGFKKPPYEITDLSDIQKTFYNVPPKYMELFNTVSADCFLIAERIIMYAKAKKNLDFSQNIIFTLADHIQFSIQRYHENMSMQFEQFYILNKDYSAEIEIGCFGIQVIKEITGIKLSKQEAYGIALHLINAECKVGQELEYASTDKVIEDIIKIIKKDLDIVITDNINLTRFCIHLDFLFQRIKNKNMFLDESISLYKEITEEYNMYLECIEDINRYFMKKYQTQLTREETFYMTLHLHRLCQREKDNE